MVFTLVWQLWGSTLKTGSYFSRYKTPLTATYDLFDLGVVDINDDDYLDIFTLNHSARQNLLLNQGLNNFTDILSDRKLDQDREFAHAEDTDHQPTFDNPGLYIYRQNFDLHIRAYQLDKLDSINGSLKLSLPVEVKKNHLSQTEIKESSFLEKTYHTIDFSLKNNGWLILTGFPEILHSFEMSEKIPLNQIQIGIQKQHPNSHNFEIMWRDRHSMAWADVNQDGYKDVFISRGGVRGKISNLSERLNDELFMSRDQITLQDQAEQLGIDKEGCPGRQSAWVDFNNDDRLDLYIVCGRSQDDPTPYPNQLYQQTENGQFVNIASKVGLDFPQVGYALWLDADNDRDMDLLTSQEETVYLYVNQNGKFQQIFSEQLNQQITKFSVSDFDLDGDFDVYVVTGDKNILLVNTNGKYVVKSPDSVGLPSKAKTANWVDFNNDGLPDLHVVPNGLYQQNSQHQFEETKLLDMRFPKFETRDARCVWFDADNDGDRDVLVAYQQTPSVLQQTPPLKDRILNQILKRDTSRIWQSRFYRNLSVDNHWIEIELLGSLVNPQAIGSRVEVVVKNNTQVQQIGSSENSHYSQGHYRLYFGLGKQEKPDLIKVFWPDGQTQTLVQPVADRLLKIDKNI